MTDIPLICDDPTPIQGLSNDGADIAWVGMNGVTEIVAYKEHGQCDFVPFFAVKTGDHIIRRVSAASVIVTYRAPPS